MGQRAYYTIEFSENQEQMIRELLEINDWIDNAIDDDGTPIDDTSWIDMESNVKELSNKYPEMLITIFEEGSSYDGKCRYYFKSGKMQECHVVETYDEFDESKLV